jgi:hypothetical protein
MSDWHVRLHDPRKRLTRVSVCLIIFAAFLLNFPFLGVFVPLADVAKGGDEAKSALCEIFCLFESFASFRASSASCHK